MPITKTFTINGLFLITIMSLFSCSGQRPANLGVTDGKLSACPSYLNCVSSDALDDAHKVLPIKFNTPANIAWQNAKDAVLKLPRTQIVTETTDYLHAECSSAVFGFIDDLELLLRASDGIITIRSASRLGHSDFGVNRRRAEYLRTYLTNHGINEQFE